MSSNTDIWIAFARTFSLLFVVLALLILVFYFIKKISMASGKKNGGRHIKVLSMHHLAPKEKLVLLDVLGETILVGVTPNRISKLTSIKTDVELLDTAGEKKSRFADLLGLKLGRPAVAENKDVEKKGQTL